MGIVYRAEDTLLDRPVALKVLRLPEAAHQARFLREASALARLDHPGIVKLYAWGLAGSVPYLAMELLDGTPLGKVEHHPDPLGLMLVVAEALDHVHRAGMVHRDLKPANVVLTRDRGPVLVDFGLARDPNLSRLTETGAIVGTPAYLAPEATSTAAVGPAADWFSWGATLYRLIEGREPLSPSAIFRDLPRGKARTPRFTRLEPGSPEAVVIRRCLSPRPERRPQSRAAVLALLSRARRGRADPRPTAEWSGWLARIDSAELASGPPPARRRPRLAPLAGLLLAGLATLVVGIRLEPAPEDPLPSTTAAPSPRLGIEGLVPLPPGASGRIEYRNPRDGSVLVWVPPGPTVLRSRLAGTPATPRSFPVEGFLIARTEVSVAQYARFLEASGRPPPRFWKLQTARPSAPVVWVDWHDATAYAAWAGARLPRSPEWERAALGTGAGRYPWGDAPPAPELARFDSTPGVDDFTAPLAWLAPVDSLPRGASPWGVLHMAGNVSEWSQDPWPDPVPGTEAWDAPGVPLRVTRGGHWASPPGDLDPGLVRPAPETAVDQTLGFRIARSAAS